MINLSADSFPVLKPRALREALAKLKGYNFMTSSTSVTGMKPTAWSEFDEKWHKRRAFRNPILEGFDAEAHYGSQVSEAFQRNLDRRGITKQSKESNATARPPPPTANRSG